MIDSFEFMNHTCLILPLYKMNLRDLLKTTNGKGIPLKLVMVIARQLILAFIQIHKNRIIHADCKFILFISFFEELLLNGKLLLNGFGLLL